MDDTEEPSMDKTYREKYLRREQIYESLENILNEIESFSGIQCTNLPQFDSLSG